jgi:hypothetical protein
MKFSLLDDLPNILERFTKRYLKWRGYPSPYLINCGECFIWAWHVYHYLKKRGIEAELVSCISHGGHAWVEIDGVAYDSEHLNGLYSEDLAFEFAQDDWDYIEVRTMDESEFFDHWYHNGGGGHLLMSPSFMEKMTRVISQCGRGWKSNNLKVS